MIYYPIQTLVDAGITDIMVVTGGKNSGDFLRLLANGKALRAEAYRLYLSGRRGRHRRGAGACASTSPTAQPICVVLGDNIIEKRYSRRGGAFPRAGSAARAFC